MARRPWGTRLGNVLNELMGEAGLLPAYGFVHSS
jgi:hypothetical protein